MRTKAILLSLVLGLGACGGDDGAPMPDAASGSDAASPPADYVELVTADWSMPPGTEGYVCARVTATEDLYINAYRPIAPPGTHHTALTIDTDASRPDGTFPCEASTVGFQILFGSGVGTTPFELPEGIAYKLSAGQAVLLNLHLYNTDDAEISGTSGIEVKLLPASAVVEEAETLYIGNLNLTVPPGQSTSYAECEMNADTTIFGVFPHMHKLGTHMLGVALPAAGGEVTLTDRPYSFEEQLNYRVDPPVQLQAGDLVRAACSYDNPGPNTVVFGDSSDDEMCILGLYRYPARGGLSFCF